MPLLRLRRMGCSFLVVKDLHKNAKLLELTDTAGIIGLEFDSVHHATVVGLGTNGALSVYV
jgi:hypothetical protein